LDASKNAASTRVGQVAEQSNGLARRSSEREARGVTDERASAEREARVASGAQSIAGEPLAETVAPAAAPVAAGRREATVQLQARAPLEIVSPNPDSRWRIVDGTAIQRSTTGGRVWEAAVITPPAQVTAGSSPGALVCWLVGPRGAIRLTTDGVQFRIVPFPERVDLDGVRATSATMAVVTAIDGRAFRTEDQGVTWVPVAP
jgi:hypothetical protein